MHVAVVGFGTALAVFGGSLAVWSSWRNVVERPRTWSVWKAALSPQHWIEPYGLRYMIGMLLLVAGLIVANRG